MANVIDETLSKWDEAMNTVLRREKDPAQHAMLSQKFIQFKNQFASNMMQVGGNFANPQEAVTAVHMRMAQQVSASGDTQAVKAWNDFSYVLREPWQEKILGNFFDRDAAAERGFLGGLKPLGLAMGFAGLLGLPKVFGIELFSLKGLLVGAIGAIGAAYAATLVQTQFFPDKKDGPSPSPSAGNGRARGLSGPAVNQNVPLTSLSDPSKNQNPNQARDSDVQSDEINVAKARALADEIKLAKQNGLAPLQDTTSPFSRGNEPRARFVPQASYGNFSNNMYSAPVVYTPAYNPAYSGGNYNYSFNNFGWSWWQGSRNPGYGFGGGYNGYPLAAGLMLYNDVFRNNAPNVLPSLGTSGPIPPAPAPHQPMPHRSAVPGRFGR